MNNPLFKTYATTVNALFDPERRAGEPILIFPGQSNKKKRKDSTDGKRLAQFANEAELQSIQAVVDQFRTALAKEKKAGKTGADEDNIHAHLKAFQEAIKDGNEAPLEDNPFYELTKLVFHLNMDAAGNLFTAMEDELVSHPPEPVYILKSLREIWFSGSGLSLGRRLYATLDNWMASGKLWISILLFFGSTFTTAQGVNDVLQSPWADSLFGGLFTGLEGEGTRYLVAVLCGLILSSAILDYKDRIFSNIAESGGVFSGLRDVILRHPRWILVATLLTVVSIKTNYDGIVSLISKKADLGKQSAMIQARVKRALGNQFFMNSVEPDSLYDLMGLMRESTDKSIAQFLQVPEDEVSGRASSGDARKGPRYWGKHLIVHGNFKPGVRTVSTVYRGGALSRTIDTMLTESGIDLSTSLKDKILALRGRYEAHMTRTEESIRVTLGKLTGMLEMRGYSLEELKRVFALEHYQINAYVQQLIRALEENKRVYEEVAAELNALTDSYVVLLQKVDRSGGATSRDYRIEGKLTIPDIQAIKDLKDNAEIPVAKHKNFEELKAFLAEEYGAASAGMLLGMILFFSFCMDLTDPLVYSRWTGKIGKQDRLMFPDLEEYLKEWENDFIKEAHRFFYRRDVQQALRGFAFPNKTAIRNALYITLEETSPAVRDGLDKERRQLFVEWFKGLFRLTRTADMRGFNARAAAITTLCHKSDRTLPRIIEYLFPGLDVTKGLDNQSFAGLLTRTETGQERCRELFAWDLKVAASGLRRVNLKVRRESDEEWEEQGDLTDTLQKLQHKRQSITKKSVFQEDDDSEERNGPAKTATGTTASKAPTLPEEGMLLESRGFFKKDSAADKIRTWLFVIAFKEQLTPYAHTRRGWLVVVSNRDKNALDDMDGLYDFLPDLKKTIMITLPKIEKESLEPLEMIRERFPERFEREGIDTAEQLQNRFQEIEKESLELLGLSRIIGDQTLLYSPVGGVDIDGISNSVFNDDDGESPDFGEKIADLVEHAEEMVGRARAIERSIVEEIEELAEKTRERCETTRQLLLKINMRGTELRKERNPPREMLRMLRSHATTLEMAPRQSESILQTMEAIFTSDTPHSETTLEVQKKLYNESSAAYEQVKNILLALYPPGSIDPSEILATEEQPESAGGDNGQTVPDDGEKAETGGATVPVADGTGDEGTGATVVEPIIDDETANDSDDDIDSLMPHPAPVAEKPTPAEPVTALVPAPSPLDIQIDPDGILADDFDGQINGGEAVFTATGSDVATPAGSGQLIKSPAGELEIPEIPPLNKRFEESDGDSPLEIGDAPNLKVGGVVKPEPGSYKAAMRPRNQPPRLSKRWADVVRSLNAARDIADTDLAANGADEQSVADQELEPVAPSGEGQPAAVDDKAPTARDGDSTAVEALTAAVESPPAAAPLSDLMTSREDSTPKADGLAAIKRGRRQSQRRPVSARVEFETEDGWRFAGMANDMSRDCLRFGSGALPPGLKGGEVGMLRITTDLERHTFPCEVVRLSNADMTLRILSRVDRFVDLFRDAAAPPALKKRPSGDTGVETTPAAIPEPQPAKPQPPPLKPAPSVAEPPPTPPSRKTAPPTVGTPAPGQTAGKPAPRSGDSRAETAPRERRRRERHELATRVSFETDDGWRFEGSTRDIATDSLRFASGILPKGLRPGDRGVLRLAADREQLAFPSEVVRLSETELALRLYAEADSFKDLVEGLLHKSGEPAAATPTPPPSEAPETATHLSRRRHERHRLQTRVAFETTSGWRFEGTTSDVGMGGLRFGSEQLPPGLKNGERGILRIISDEKREAFPCEVVRLSEDDLTLKIFSGAPRLEMLLKHEIFKQLRQDHTTLKKERESRTGHPGHGPGPV